MALREILASFDIDTSGLEKSGKKAESDIAKLKNGLKELGVALVGVEIVRGIKDMVMDLAEQGKQLELSSQKLGIGTHELQQWQTAAKLAGVDGDAFNGILKKFEVSAGKAAKGGADSGGEFQKLGVKLRDAAGNARPVTDVLTDTGIAISKLADPFARADAVQKTFGRSGAALIPMFNKGEAGLKEYLGQLDKLGGGLSDDAIGSLAGLKESTEKWDVALLSLKGKVVSAFLPAMTQIISYVTGGVVAFSRNKSAVTELTVGVGALGVAGAAAAVAFIAPWLPAIVGFTVLGLLVQDFIVGLKGGDSEIGHLIDKAFGPGAGKSFFVELKKDAEAFIAKVRELLGLLQSDPGTMKGGESGRTHRIAEALGMETKIDGTSEETEAKRQIRDNDFKFADESLNPLNWMRKQRAYSDADKGTFESDDDFTKRKAEDANQLRGQIGLNRAGINDESHISDIFAAMQRPMVNVPGSAAGKAGEPTTKSITQSNTNNITINAPSGDAADIKDGVLDGTGAANRAALAALDKRPE